MWLYAQAWLPLLTITLAAGTRAFSGPAIGEFVLLTDTHLILEPNLYWRANGSVARISATRRAKFF